MSPRVPGLTERALDRIYGHVWEHPESEVGGVLVGDSLGDGSAMVVGSIPALAAAGQRDSLTFTHAAWQEIHHQLDRDYPDKHIVGWYHSHPGLGVFFSEHDKFVHRFFFSSPHQVGLVIDPVAGSQGMFGWVGDAVEALGDVVPTRRAGLREVAGQKPASGHDVALDDLNADAPRRAAARASVARAPAVYTPLALLLPLLAGLLVGFVGFGVLDGDGAPKPAGASEGKRLTRAECQRLVARGSDYPRECEDVLYRPAR